MNRYIPVVCVLFMLAGCAGQWESLPGDESKSAAQSQADKIFPVSGKNRDVRVCLLASVVTEVMTAQVMRNKRPADIALARLLVLRGAVQKAKTVSPDWLNSDMADIGLTFSKVLRESGQSRMAEIMMAGLSATNILNVLKVVTVFTD